MTTTANWKLTYRDGSVRYQTAAEPTLFKDDIVLAEEVSVEERINFFAYTVRRGNDASLANAFAYTFEHEEPFTIQMRELIAPFLEDTTDYGC